MMLHKPCILEIVDNYLIKHDLYSSFMKSRYRSSEYKLNLLREAQFCLCSKKVLVVLEGEKINIKNMTLPRLKKPQISRLIAEELAFSASDLEKVYFSYTIIKEGKTSIQLFVYYSKEGKPKILSNYMTGKSFIKKVHMIQFWFLKYFKASFKHKDFIFVFIYRSVLYLICCIDGKVSYNEAENYGCEEVNLVEMVMDFCEGCRINNGLSIKNIYLANIDSESIKYLDTEGYLVFDLGYVEEKQMIKSIRSCRR